MAEGKSVQMLHVDPFSTEPDSLALIAEFCKANRRKRNGM